MTPPGAVRPFEVAAGHGKGADTIASYWRGSSSTRVWNFARTVIVETRAGYVMQWLAG